jgi:Tol biopolymer transport system component
MPGDAVQGAPKAQVWILSLSGGESRRVTNFRNGVTVFAWSPDSTRFVCVTSSGPSDKAKSPSDVRHYKHANYKSNETGWFDDKRTHLWLVEAATGAAKQLTSGDDWNDRDPQWSPDGTKIAFVSDRTGKEFGEGSNSDVWVIDAGGGPLTKISESDEPDFQPRWSPDGRTIAFLGESEQQAFPGIWLAPGGGGSMPNPAVENLDLIPTQLKWAEGGKALYFEAGIKGETHLFRVDPEKRRATQVTTGERTLRLVDINDRTRRIAYAADDPMHLCTPKSPPWDGLPPGPYFT